MRKKLMRTYFMMLSITLMGGMEAMSQNKPNIILIMADDLGYEALGTYGGTSYRTPNLDRLAEEGMRFDHCYSMPLCTPSRVQLMTGKYNNRNYIGFGLLDPKEKTFGHYMKEAGYSTYIAGKWQLLGNPNQQQLAGNKIGTTPEKAGFDDYCLWQIDQLGSRYKDPKLSTKNGGTQTYPGKYGPDIFLQKIVSFMEDNKDSPFFVYYPMALTHDPFVPTPLNKGFSDFDSSSKVNDPAYFGEMVTYMDMIVGSIVKKTDELGIRENTLILFVGDNGTDIKVSSMVNGSLVKGNKGQTTDAGTHVPLIANWKGKIAPKSVNDNLIDFTDFLPTLLDCSRLEKKEAMFLDGISFFPQLLGNNSETRDWIFCHYDPNWGKFKARRYVQNKKWKLYGNGEFYNLEQDILEIDPLKISHLSGESKTTLEQFQEVLKSYK
ncbi:MULTISPECIES: sulfatase-like hydrolase/transferase [unclassified Arenibacter]|uniref:sulfatase-like hydrolase/transferase n=1 Tax=unclassified Arenibacter TaxID=2615047 RepID=UPI0020444D4C|nr:MULTISPECIES: sulfatase-like hydrolase/transferase [unclassified Arenibacter]